MADPKASESIKYLVDVDFSDEDGGPIRLRTKEDVQSWQQKEAEFWGWLFKYQNSGFFGSIENFRNRWSRINKTEVSPDTVRSILQEFTSGIPIRKNGRETPSKCFHSRSVKAQAVNKVKESHGELAALGALLFALEADFTSLNNGFLPQAILLGAFQYTLIYQGISSETTEVAFNALEGVRNRAQQKFDALEQKSEKLISSLEERAEGFDRARDVLKRYASSRWSAFKTKSEKDVDAAIQKIHNTDELFKRHMEIKAPVQYWRDKKDEHLRGKKKYSSWLAVFAPLSLSCTFALILGFPAIMMWVGYPQTVWHYISIPFLLVWTTTIFWAGRVLVRLFLSEHHLASDAEERAVMAKTYLALVNEDKADKEDRNIVLATLFRHSTDGIVKDDAAPSWTPQSFMTGR